MLTPYLIEKTLEANFDLRIQNRGFAYYRLGMVSAVNINRSGINAKVRGSDIGIYEVVFNYDERFKVLEGQCNCPFEGDCKHQVAVLYHVLEDLKEGSGKSTLKMLSDAIFRPKTKKQVKREIRRAKNAELEGSDYTGEYRFLPIKGKRLSEVLREYKPRSYRGLGWNETFIGTFLSDLELEIKSVSTYANFPTKEQKICIKREGDFLAVKCLTCNIELPSLCEHQMALLSKSANVLSTQGFLSGRINYQNMVNEAVKQTGVHAAAFHNYFHITLSAAGFNIEAKFKNMSGPEWLKLTKEFTEKDKEDRNTALQQQLKQLEEGRRKKYAFFWGVEEYDYYDKGRNDVLYFMSGNGFKTKDGIHGTGREIEELPTGFPEPYQSLGRELFFLNQETYLPTRFEGVQNLILENLETFNEIYQYISNEEFGAGQIRASNLHLVQFHPTVLACEFSIYEKDGLIHFERQLSLDDTPFDYSKIIFTNPFFCATKDKAYLVPNYRFNDFMNLFDKEDLVILPYTSKQEYTELVTGLKRHFKVNITSDLVMEESVLKDPTCQILLREVGNFVLFEPILKYGDYSFNAFDEDNYYIEDEVFKVEEIDRQFLVNFLKNAHTEFSSPVQVQDYVYLEIKSMINDYWFMHFNEACEAAGIEVVGVKDLTKFKYSKHRAVTFSHVKSGIDWFEVDMGISFGDEKIKTADWIKALRNKETFVQLKDGSLGILPEEWLEQARKILAVADVEKGDLKISKYRFNIIEDLFEDIDDKKIIKELEDKKRRLANIELDKKYPIPKIIKATLRDYQKHGFAWLKFLDESGFGGILADDMGLGKTLQVISLLADQIEEAPSLVVVPRSLLFNWAAEIDKFCPDLQYIIHHGTGRAKMIEELLPIHVIITTYGTAASDIELFKDFEFNYVILDESQAIKNPESKRYKAMRLLQAKNKIAMTGTPIENNTFDLYAQLSFTSPGLLGTKTGFKNHFAVPIDNHSDVEAAALLRKLVHPFLLRRTKEQVAKDLPAKTESIIYCEMGPTQRKLYNNLKSKIKEDITAVIEEKGIAKSKFQMLDGLLRLRQMCNSPLLINRTFKGSNADSVKINILLQHLTEELDQHNALIFSQFTSLLAIVRKELDDRGIPYAYLDGSTTKRQEEVDKFMNNDELKIFLISLKAGNTGMNLTKADYVYILDPWWNPAVEAQAIDRTHRIGQDKQIFAYKLICKDSIEEKILKLQAKKKNLAEDIIRTDENVLKSLKKDELMALFE